MFSIGLCKDFRVMASNFALVLHSQFGVRLQNSRIFCERERRPLLEQKVWSECKSGDVEWGETCLVGEAHVLHT